MAMVVETRIDSICRRSATGPDNGLGNVCSAPEKFAGKVDFKQYEDQGERLIIPASHLFGTQPLEQYESAKRRVVEAKLARCGVECLKEYPVPLLGLPEAIGLTLAIVDHHHRTRYTGRYGIYEIPSVLYTPAQLVDIFNENNVYPWPIDEEFLIRDYNAAVSEALVSFARSLPERKRPRIMRVENIDSLKGYYQSF